MIQQNNFLDSLPIFLLRKTPDFDENAFRKIEEKKAADNFSRIRCPLCKWQPTNANRWFCADAGFPEYFFGGCGTMWNTFATRGICPGCNHRWRWTTCLACGEWSRHQDWYSDKKED